MGERIIFEKNAGSKIKKETINDMPTSLFKDVYINIFEKINYLMNESNELNDSNVHNNLIVLFGERGSGKTSCLETIEYILKNQNLYLNQIIEEKSEKTSLKEILLKLNEKKYIFLERIDPTFFIEGTNILEIFIALIFKEFKNDIEKSEKEVNYSLKNELLICFQKVFENIKYLSKKENIIEDDIEELMNLATVIDLQANISKLCEQFIQYFNVSKIFLQIDDLDLNSEYAYNLMEQIRKYLLNDKIIIILTSRFSQLSNALANKEIKINKNLVDKEIISLEEINNRTYNYLNKLFPIEHRFYLPEINAKKLIDVTLKANTDFNLDQDNSLETLELKIYKYIYKNTNVLFLPKESNYLVYLIPKSLRSFYNLIKLLESFKPNKESFLKNLNKLENYFLNIWLKENLVDSDQKFIEALFYESSYEKMNLILSLNEPEIPFRKGLTIYDLVIDILGNKKLDFAIKTVYTFILQKFNLDEQYEQYNFLINNKFPIIYHQYFDKITLNFKNINNLLPEEKKIAIEKIKHLTIFLKYLRYRKEDDRIDIFNIFFNTLVDKDDEEIFDFPSLRITSIDLMEKLFHYLKDNNILTNKKLSLTDIIKIYRNIYNIFKIENYYNQDKLNELIEFLNEIDKYLELELESRLKQIRRLNSRLA